MSETSSNTALLSETTDRLVVLPDSPEVSKSRPGHEPNIEPIANGDYEYTDYWHVFGAAHPDIAEEAERNAVDVMRHRHEVYNYLSRVAHNDTEKRPYQPLRSAREFYRSLGQHNPLNGAEKDLRACYRLVYHYLRAVDGDPDWSFEAGSILADLSRLEHIPAEARTLYRHTAINRLDEAIRKDRELHKWSEDDKIHAQILHDDLAFDDLHEQFLLLRDSHEIEHFNVLKAKYLAQLQRSIARFGISLESCKKAGFDPLQTQGVSFEKLDEVKKLRGSLFEWSYLLKQRYEIFAGQEFLDSQVQHTTLRQDRGHDSYSGSEGQASDNFDVMIKKLDENGQVSNLQEIQLKVGEEKHEYRKPIAIHAISKPAMFTTVVEGIEAIEKKLHGEDSAEDKERIKELDKLIPAVV